MTWYQSRVSRTHARCPCMEEDVDAGHGAAEPRTGVT